MKKLVVMALACWMLFACSGNSTRHTDFDTKELQTFIQEQRDAYNVPGIQVCIKDDNFNVIAEISTGYMDLESQTPMAHTTQIKAGSITKSFTAMAILRLAQKGLIDLEDEVGQYIAIENETYRQIPISALMNMHSGLRDYLNDDEDDDILDRQIENPSMQFTPEELIQYAFQLTDEQGMTGPSEFHYTNTNYVLLGMIIENVSQMRYADFIRFEIAEPLGLFATYVPIDNNFDENVSSGYYVDEKTNTIEAYSDLDLSYVWSAGAIITTASDLCDWMSLIGTDQIVSGEFLDGVYSGFPVDDGANAYYTSGLINETDKLWHNGTVLGYHGEMRYLKTEGVSMVVLTNASIVGTEEDPVKNILEKITSMIAED